MNEEWAYFEKDDAFSRKMHPSFMEYYKGELFQKQIQKLAKRGKVEVLKIDDCDNLIFQKETYIDTIISLSTGVSILIDEKAERYPSRPEFLRNFCIEIVSNPQGKQMGWGYHIGRTILKAHVNRLENGFIDDPMLFTITNNFVNEVTRNTDYPFIPNKKTNGLYRSGFKAIPKTILENYFP